MLIFQDKFQKFGLKDKGKGFPNKGFMLRTACKLLIIICNSWNLNPLKKPAFEKRLEFFLQKLRNDPKTLKSV